MQHVPSQSARVCVFMDVYLCYGHVAQCQSVVHLKSIFPPHGCGDFSAALDFWVTSVSHRATVLHVFTADCLRKKREQQSV